ncbi:MAG: hypothetical protein AAGD96_27175 [Chloroflexota bacterium]
MKSRKRVRRFIFPIMLVGFVLIVGVALAGADDYHHSDFGYSELMMEHAIEMEELQIELDEMMRDHSIEKVDQQLELDELVLEHSLEVAELQEELAALTHEFSLEMQISPPPAPEIKAIKSDPVIVIENSQAESSTTQTNVGLVSVLIGGLALSMIFVMVMMVVVDDYRGRREE